MPCQTPPHAAPAASPRLLTGVQALALAGFAVYYVVELVLGEGSDATRVLMSALLILVGGAGLGVLARGLARCRRVAAHPDDRLERAPPAGRHQPDPGQPGARRLGRHRGGARGHRRARWVARDPDTEVLPGERPPRLSRSASSTCTSVASPRGDERRHAPAAGGCRPAAARRSRPRSAAAGLSTRRAPVPGHLDVDPAEPGGERRRRRRDDDQPVVAVDEADDLAQHGTRGRRRRAGRRRRRTPRGRGGVAAAGRAASRSPGAEDGGACRPRHAAGVDSRARRRPTNRPCGTEGFGDHPRARWCGRTAAGRRRASRRPSELGAPASTAAPGRRRRPGAPLVRRTRAAPAAAPSSCRGTSARRTERRQGDPPPAPPPAGPGAERPAPRSPVVGGVARANCTSRRVVHPHGPAGRRVAGHVGGAQAGERCVERVDACRAGRCGRRPRPTAGAAGCGRR